MIKTHAFQEASADWRSILYQKNAKLNVFLALYDFFKFVCHNLVMFILSFKTGSVDEDNFLIWTFESSFVLFQTDTARNKTVPNFDVDFFLCHGLDECRLTALNNSKN